MRKKFIVGIDLGGTNLRIAILDLKYNIKDRNTLSTKSFKKKNDLVTAIADSVNKILSGNNLRKKDILGIGLGLPGPVEEKTGIVHFFPNIPGWKEVNLKKILKARFGVPVFLDNDAKLMSLAEYRLGNAKDFQNAICLTLGTGVGGAIIINGNLYRGKDNAAGEIGHIPINESGPRCNCGGRACLETYIGNNKIINEAKQAFKRDISLEELSALAKRGNKRAIAIWSKVAGRLGAGLVAVVNLLNPEAIVIGGGVANAGNFLFAMVREKVKKQAMSVQAAGVRIFKAKLGNRAGLIGAAILVKEGLAEAR